MGKTITIIGVILAVLVVISAAGARSTASDPRVPALQAKVVTLQHQVAAIAGIMRRDEDLNTCRWTYQGHINYAFLNIFAALLGEAPIPDNTPSDQGACQRVGIAPPRRSAAGTGAWPQLQQQVVGMWRQKVLDP